jgi:ribosome maturation factor RimP
MIRKEEIEKFIGSKIGIQLSGNCYYKGILKQVKEDTIVLEFLNGKQMIVLLDKIEFLKGLE